MGDSDKAIKWATFVIILAVCLVIIGVVIGRSQTIQPISIGVIFIVILLMLSKDFGAYLFLFFLFPFKVLLTYFYQDQVTAAVVRDGILILLTLKCFFDVALERKQLLPSPVAVPIMVFFLYAMTYLLGTEKGVIALIDFRSKMLYIAVFFLTVHFVNTHDRLMKVLYVLMGVVFLISFLGVFQQLMGPERLAQLGIKPRYGFRDTGYFLVAQEHLFSNAIVGGLIPAGKIAVFFSLCFLHLRKKIPLLLLITVTGVFGLIFTFSRTTFIILVAGICWLSLFTRWKKLIIVTLICVIFFFTFTTGWVYNRFEDIFHPFTNTSFLGRVYSYVRAIEGFTTYAFGSGFGSVGGALKGWDKQVVETDTYYVTIFMTLGFPGFIIFLWMSGALILKGFFVIWYMEDRFYKLTAIAAYTYVCQQYIAIVTIDSFHTLPTAFYFWVCAGLLFVLEELDIKKIKEKIAEETVSTGEVGLVPAVQPS